MKKVVVANGRRTATIIFALCLVGVVAAGTFVALAAQEAILDSRSGSVSEAILDPSAPGFRAFTEATPTVLVAHTSQAISGELVGATILTPADASIGGTVITVQSTFLPDSSSPSLRDLFARGGLDAVASALGEAIGAGFTSTIALDGASWASLIGDDLPVTLTLRTDLVDTQGDVGQVVVLAGTREFEGDEIADIVTHQNSSEPSLGVALRHQEVWRAWISQTQDSTDQTALVEFDAGLADVFAALENGEVSFRTIPTVTLATDATENTTYLANESAIETLFAQIVPFPNEIVPGNRPPVLLLDSTRGEVPSGPFAEAITRSGGRVTILGNTTEEPEVANRVQFHDPAGAELARGIGRALGVTDVEEVPVDDATTSVTVIIGAPIAGS